MTNQEFSDNFSTMLNSYASKPEFGEQAALSDLVLDEYEKSVYLTMAEDIITKSYFDRTLNQQAQGFDDTARRQIDFSSLISIIDLYPINGSTFSSTGTIASGISTSTLPEGTYFRMNPEEGTIFSSSSYTGMRSGVASTDTSAAAAPVAGVSYPNGYYPYIYDFSMKYYAYVEAFRKSRDEAVKGKAGDYVDTTVEANPNWKTRPDEMMAVYIPDESELYDMWKYRTDGNITEYHNIIRTQIEQRNKVDALWVERYDRNGNLYSVDSGDNIFPYDIVYDSVIGDNNKYTPIKVHRYTAKDQASATFYNNIIYRGVKLLRDSGYSGEIYLMESHYSWSPDFYTGVYSWVRSSGIVQLLDTSSAIELANGTLYPDGQEFSFTAIETNDITISDGRVLEYAPGSSTGSSSSLLCNCDGAQLVNAVSFYVDGNGYVQFEDSVVRHASMNLGRSVLLTDMPNSASYSISTNLIAGKSLEFEPNLGKYYNGEGVEPKDTQYVYVNVYGLTTWSASLPSNTNWVSVTPVASDDSRYNAKLKVTLDPQYGQNTRDAFRSVIVTLSGNAGSQGTQASAKFTIMQLRATEAVVPEDVTLVVTPQELNFTAAQMSAMNVEPNIAVSKLTIQGPEASWCRVTPDPVRSRIYVSCDKNTGTVRTTTFAVTYTPAAGVAQTKTITVQQSSAVVKTLKADINVIKFNADTTPFSIPGYTHKTKITLSITDDDESIVLGTASDPVPSWVHLSLSNGIISVSVDENSGELREYKLPIKYGSQTVYCTLQQLKPDPATSDIPADPDPSDPEEYTPTLNIGSGELKMFKSTNADSQNLHVSFFGTEYCYLSDDQDGSEYSPIGYPLIEFPWIHILCCNADGSAAAIIDGPGIPQGGYFKITLDDNPSQEKRTATVRLHLATSHGDEPLDSGTFNIVQDSKPKVSVSPNKLTFDAADTSTKTFVITKAGAVSDTVVPSSTSSIRVRRVDESTVSVSMTENTSTKDNLPFITVTATNESKETATARVDIVQAGVKTYVEPKDSSSSTETTTVQPNTEEAIANQLFDDRSLLYRLPRRKIGGVEVAGTTDVLFILNEKLTIKHTNSKFINYTIRPISYTEYDRMMSKPYSYPLKKQAWRLFQNQTTGFDIFSEIIPANAAMKNVDNCIYRLRYVRRPRPIILEDLPDGLAIDGYSNETTCELNPILHMDILAKAVELAYNSRVRVTAGNTEKGR